MFTKQEVYNETLKYFNGDSMLASVWLDKYALKNNTEYLEKTPDDMHKRLAKEFARIESKYPNPLSYEEIYDLLKDFKYIIPGGSILYGVGNDYSFSSIGNCFVIGNNADSYGGICTTDQELTQLFKRRSGVGHDVSHLRPNKTPTSNAAGHGTGPVSFMDRYSHTARETAQSGRRGAQMITININHPDIEQFIKCKDDLTKVTGANISVKVTDEFMKAVENDKDFRMTWNKQRGLVKDGSKNEGDKTVLIKAKELWNLIIHQATTKAEPGVLFWDTITRESIPSCYGEEWKETSTNPCGEIPLCPYDSCRLLSVNLYSFVEHPFTDKAFFNYDKFKDVVYKSQRLMDDVVDLEEEKINLILKKIENDPEPDEIKSVEKNLWLKIKDKLLQGRRTGLSSIGLADCLASLDVIYGSDRSIQLAEKIYKQFAISAYKSSIDMARERGAFPIFNSKLEGELGFDKNPFITRILSELNGSFEDGDFSGDIYTTLARRNIALLTVPPSGTISMFGNKNGISSGIEPVYQLYYKRRRKLEKDNPNITFVDQNGDGWEEYTVLHPKYNEWCKIHDVTMYEDKFLSTSPRNPYYQSTAYEIDPLQRVKLQSTIQKWIDHSISSTINLPENTTEETVSNIYMEAWKQGCKGVTVYVNNCRTGVLVDIDKEESEFKQHDAPKRPKSLPCIVHKTKSRGKEWLVVVGLLNDKPYEVFTIENNYGVQYSEIKGQIIKVKRGQYDLSLQDETYIEDFTKNIPDTENLLTRMISTALRHGSNIQFIVEQLNKSEGDITSFGKATARILKQYIEENKVSSDVCPECGSTLVYQSGCKQCNQCGYSKCG